MDTVICSLSLNKNIKYFYFRNIFMHFGPSPLSSGKQGRAVLCEACGVCGMLHNSIKRVLHFNHGRQFSKCLRLRCLADVISVRRACTMRYGCPLLRHWLACRSATCLLGHIYLPVDLESTLLSVRPSIFTPALRRGYRKPYRGIPQSQARGRGRKFSFTRKCVDSNGFHMLR